MIRIIINRLFFIIIGTVIGAALLYIGCAGEEEINLDTSLRIPARNIVFRNTQNNALAQIKTPSSRSKIGDILFSSAYAQDAQLDETIQVLAENVIIDTVDNSLESGNLQDALDNEMAIDIPSALSGKTWSVENRAGLEEFHNSEGQITFTSSSEFTLDSGKLATPEMMTESEALSIGWHEFTIYSIEVEFLSSNVLFLTWYATKSHDYDIEVTYRAVVQVIPVNKDKFIFIGYSPVSGHYGVSTLTFIE